MATATDLKSLFPSGWVKAWQSVAGAGEVHRGEMLPLTDWRVELHGENVFVDSRVPERNWPSFYDTVGPSFMEREQYKRDELAREGFLSAAKANPVRLDVDSVYVCIADHPSMLAGEACTVKKGSRALADSEAVRQAPDKWKPER